MRINNNLMAANTNRMLGVNQSNASKSMEKLSSGLRINKGGDDAAGLAISEKMRAQIKGLNQASKNAQDGISLLQTADGAMGQQHAILQRMRELAVQASTGTLQDADRGQIDKEFQQLKLEVNDIAAKTQFNKMDLMSGSFGARVSGGSVALETFDATTGAHAGGMTGVSGIQLNGTQAGTYTFTDDGTDITVVFTAASGGTSTVNLAGRGTKDGAQTINIEQFGITITTKGAGIQSNGTTTVPGFTGGSLDGTIIVEGAAVNVQTGANAGETLGVTIRDMTTGATGLNLAASNTLSSSAASTAITSVEAAIKTVSDERAKLGAISNRLEYKMNSIDSTSENLQSAESKIRDVDMAKEMVNYSKTDILNQAAQAMLAKANQAPQNILQLLR